VINGEAASNYSGGSVSSAGDVNGDGLDDLIVGANKIYLHLIYHLDRQYKHLKSNHPSHHH
jgi:hypothetical protein